MTTATLPLDPTHAATMARHDRGPCRLERADWPYDCDAKRLHPDHVVVRCAAHGAWWHAPALEQAKATPAPLRFTRLPDPAAGCRAYLVVATDEAGTEGILGTVTNRRGDWWRAVTDHGDMRGSFHSTRREAAAALLP